eukprot:COSAG02_NODE_2525_length_8606_cov_5.841895_1_plen_81_part_00
MGPQHMARLDKNRALPHTVIASVGTHRACPLQPSHTQPEGAGAEKSAHPTAPATIPESAAIGMAPQKKHLHVGRVGGERA